jgi:hypothetical protein
MSPFNFEAGGDISEWPKNEPGKPTQVAIFGIGHPEKGAKAFEMLWTGKFPDLDQAMYWGAKKEMQAMRKGKWMAASRVLWQHNLTPEQAVAAVYTQMQPQLDRAMASAELGGAPDIGEGPMKPIDYSKAKGLYVEVADPSNPDGPDPIEPFFVPFDDDDDRTEKDHIPNDPRDG